MKYTNPQVIARNQDYGTMDFFVTAGGTEHFLFRTPYFSKGIFAEFSAGCPLRSVFRKTYSVRMRRLRAHILRNVRALEEELGIELLDRPKQGKHPNRNSRRGRHGRGAREWLDAA